MIIENLRSPHIIEATYRIVTPMFIGDAQQEASGISPQSVKGALRFWWRALNWGKIRSQKEFDTDEKALKKLHEQEAKLFGLAMDEARDRFNKNKKSGEATVANGQGKFFLRVLQSKNLVTTAKDKVHSDFSKHEAARYFGYGLMEAYASKDKNTQAGQLTRSCVNENQTFTVHLIFRDRVEDSILDTLIIMGLLGGLGSRTRRGMGSIALEQLILRHDQHQTNLYDRPLNKDQYIDLIQKHIPSAVYKDVKQPPFSAFNKHSRIDFLVEKNSSLATLNELAKGMVKYRSWGKKGKVLGEDSEKNFQLDHDWKDTKREANFHPRRVMFGLPHNYGKGYKYAVTPEKHEKLPYPKDYYKHERRASPLLFHIHQIGSSYFGISILLPAAFLPKDEKINAGGNNVPTKVEWAVLTKLIDGTIQLKKNGQTRFPDKKHIFRGEDLL